MTLRPSLLPRALNLHGRIRSRLATDQRPDHSRAGSLADTRTCLLPPQRRRSSRLHHSPSSADVLSCDAHCFVVES